MTATADIGNEIAGKPISELSTLIHDRQVSCVEVTQSFLDRIDAYNARVNAYVTVTAEQALATAAERDEELARGEDRGALHGIPIGHKDLYWTKGVLTTGCSKVLEDWVPDEDATVVTKWHDAGTVMLGKLNTHEFAYGSTSLPSLFGPSRNPWDPDRITGGSSGGSAAATIMGLCAGSTGSDSGGSIRMPSGACGTVGLKPTFGLGSRHGILPLMWSMDHPGPITTTVRDAALLMGPTAGYDVNDRTTVDRPEVDYTALLGESLKGKRIGIPTRYFYSRADPEIVAVVHKAIAVFRDLGAEAEEVELDYIDYAGAASAVMHLAEPPAYHDDTISSTPELFTQSIRNQLLMGSYVLAKDYLHAQRYRTLLGRSFKKALSQYDVLVVPTLPIAAPRLTEETVTVRGQREATFFTMLRNTEPLDLVGLPTLAVPCGFSALGLPIGMQIIGRPFDEQQILQFGDAFESATEWHKRRPVVEPI